MIAGYKNHVGLYPHPETIEHFASKLDKYKYIKGAVQFSNKEELPKELIIDRIQYIYNQIKNRE